MNDRSTTTATEFLPRTVFEDDEILVLDKPAGLLVLPDRYDTSLPNLLDWLRGRYESMYVVHRIDKETSGLIVFAKSERSHRGLNRQFENRETQKTYRAICVGETERDSGTIDLPISESPGKKGNMRIDNANGKPATTLYTVTERFVDYTFVETHPQTGRTHQIRVHLSAIHLPILGDVHYGGGRGFYLSSIKPGYRRKEEEKPLLQRTALHASRISFVHPGNGEAVSFESELPKDMRIVLNYLRKFRKR